MKRLIASILTFVLTATMAIVGQAGSGAIKDKSGSTKARFSTDSSGTTTFRDNSGRRLGTIDKNGVSRDNSGRRQSTISSNGTVRDTTRVVDKASSPPAARAPKPSAITVGGPNTAFKRMATFGTTPVG